MKRFTLFAVSLTALVLLCFGSVGFGQTPYAMSGGDYSEQFTNIASTTAWPNGFNGTDCAEWAAVPVNATGTIGDGIKTTVSTASFTTSTSGGVQRGSANIYMLSTSTANACAIDLLLDFTGRNAGTISFNVATVFNGSGDRDSKLKLFYSTNGTTFTEITGTNLPYTARNNVAGSATITNIALPSAFNGVSTERLRFYEYSTTTGGTPTGSQPKISIDNIAVTSTSASNTAPTVTTQAVSAIGSTSATGNGNITQTGGVNPNTRGVCWVLYSNATDPTISDYKVEETGGSFGTGAYTESMTSNLSAETRYKLKAYATNSVGTGYGALVNFWTLSLEPAAHSTTFSNSVVSQTQIDLSFDAASSITNADGYIILRKTGSAPTGLPVDGTSYSVGGAVGDATIAAIVSSSSATTASISSLSAGTSYYFTLIPFNFNGTNNETYNYKTDGSIPGTNGTTLLPLDADSYVSAPATQADPVLVSSTTDTDPEAVEVFKFVINDKPDG